jgi:hypothetical protein
LFIGGRENSRGIEFGDARFVEEGPVEEGRVVGGLRDGSIKVESFRGLLLLL